jgi:hypothetical protein
MADAAVWMGPATAVIVVQATLNRTLANGIRRVLAVTASVMIADLVVGSWNPAASDTDVRQQVTASMEKAAMIPGTYDPAGRAGRAEPAQGPGGQRQPLYQRRAHLVHASRASSRSARDMSTQARPTPTPSWCWRTRKATSSAYFVSESAWVIRVGACHD